GKLADDRPPRWACRGGLPQRRRARVARCRGRRDLNTTGKCGRDGCCTASTPPADARTHRYRSAGWGERRIRRILLVATRIGIPSTRPGAPSARPLGWYQLYPEHPAGQAAPMSWSYSPLPSPTVCPVSVLCGWWVLFGRLGGRRNRVASAVMSWSV